METIQLKMQNVWAGKDKKSKSFEFSIGCQSWVFNGL